jgi:hypothetical protein
MQFAMFLVDNGVISCDEFFEALKLQLHSRPQLGSMAIGTRRLTFRQVSHILREQCDEPNQMFGEIAVRLGYLTEDDLSRLLAEQAAQAKPLGDVLVENGFLAREESEQYFAQFRQCMKDAESALALSAV